MFITIFLSILFALLSVLNTNKLIGVKNYSSTSHLHMQTKVLMIIPVIALLIISVVIYNFHSLYEERISHALLVLSMWMVTTNSIFIYRNIKSQNCNKATTVALALMSLIVAIYFTPLERYNSLFNSHYYVVPFLLSLSLIVITYINLFRMRKALFSAPTNKIV